MIVDDGFWHDVNDLHTPFLLLGVGRPLLEGQGPKNSARVGEALLLTGGATFGLKEIFRERRPNSDARDSFPSSHSATAFVVATMNASLYPREAPYWYGAATLLSVARNEIGAHYFHDVVAGAALGYGFGRFFAARRNGLVIAPLFRDDARGAQLSVRF